MADTPTRNYPAGTEPADTRTPTAAPNDLPGGTNALDPSGASHRTGTSQPEVQGRGARNDSDNDAERLFEDSRHGSPSEAKQFARDAADADTRPLSPHGAGEPRAHQIDGDPKHAPISPTEKAAQKQP